ncbi:putative lipid II flippase FtsW [Paenibacillus thiaminolyticus]|uniref:Probable peptidoglycan glycosyltransferase FtsW n=1 Tax=Paenibacillus thiaminolyticus TaxID=49283 RepID=A0AAP9DTZ1_PANTH|nr:putative lipid II flippase FtsW [Paenibacillus thiaminolyticus]MCY9533751.1 putative lipid II flippase FtsW [Paenibacillus thiaminolyticus]MCY9600242.1 putative lipid II flippase FtsW [Paenibacillus thiaminolyticus]MCY9607802.1 putative lipid II flippase FtsW [Paenibacillus thiaminolyticus]MCY9611945.1 putative lipid II flippase FtsW [Paenibacillus thiaminolyticus]MCY9617835.1 putative lipid II flippase FtsW [Paenibacillus thiaminolyticus]
MKQTIKGRPDFLLLFVTLLLVMFGLAMIYSASSVVVSLKYEKPSYYMSKQMLFALIGLVAMFVFMNIPFRKWSKAAPFLLLFSIVLLVLVPYFGIKVNGATRWFSVGGMRFQPTEFAKLALIIYLSHLISKKGERIRVFARGLLPILIVIGVMLLLIMLQPDFGSVMIITIISMTIIIIGGANMRHIVMLSGGFGVLLVFLAFSRSYRYQRIISFLNPFDDPEGSGYQLIQSLIALAHGGVTGTGYGQSVQKLFYLPEAHTDFIFAIIGEEFGFVGGLLLLFCFFLFFWRGLMAALRSDEPFGIMLGTGIITMIFAQFAFNLGAVTGAMPIKGVPLPFISYGGSSLLLCMASTGILLNISRDNDRRQRE